MSSLSAETSASSSSCRAGGPGDGNQVQPKAPLLQLLRIAGAQEDVFTLKEVMHYLGEYINGKQLYDKQRQHIVHCQDDPLGELLEVDSFSVKNPSPVYEMLKKYVIVLGSADAAENLSVGHECVEGGVEDRGQMCGGVIKAGLEATSDGPPLQTSSQRRPREPDEDSLEGLPRSACKRPKLEVTLDEWDLSGLPWWFLGNLRSNYNRRSNGSTDIHTNQMSPAQEEDTAIVSDTTDDLWFLTEGGSEQVSVEMKEAALEEGSAGEGEALPEEEDGGGKEEKSDLEMQEEPDEDSQCLSDDTDTEISTQDAWQCSECRKYNSPLQRYCVRCWALRRNWYKDVPRLAHSLSVPDIPACSALTRHDEEDDSDTGIDIPDCIRTVSDPVILPSHSTPDRPLPTMITCKGKGPRRPVGYKDELLSGGEGQESLGMEVEVRPEALLEPCKLCRVRPRNGNIIHGRTAHLLTCFPCARRLHKFQAPCPGCGKIIQKVIKIFVL
ncbi:protein Mdm4 isoform X1 [Dunckerocampus dactyliophorus]|uniref:protein Mdm4 isoform X1 n=1 Tax=Dunckerocampus dactyliophorus TaxID=161453 RepID=UPI0024052053|nr:protein Mdm4 isoform X1 [Dunckerocampus dactyliophorus]